MVALSAQLLTFRTRINQSGRYPLSQQELLFRWSLGGHAEREAAFASYLRVRDLRVTCRACSRHTPYNCLVSLQLVCTLDFVV